MLYSAPMIRGVNVGCGATPTPGFVNLDNSLTVRLAARPLVGRAVSRLLKPHQRYFVDKVIGAGIRWADATRLPLADASMDVVYTAHMLEHLGPARARAFLAEARRVLVPGGVVRIVLPDLEKLVQQYRETGDADLFVSRTLLATERPDALLGRLRVLAVGFRDHRWMYDARSLSKLLVEAGFVEPRTLPPGETTLADAGALDLAERADESLYVEARR